MKKVFAVLVGCLLVFSASAQTIKKGQAFLDPTLTNLGFNTGSITPEGSSSSVKATRFGLQAAGGFAVIDNLAIEAGIGFQTMKGDDTPLSLFDVYAGARYYVIPNLFAGADLMLMSGKVGDSSFMSKDSINALNLVVKAGYDFFVSEHFAFEPSVSYLFSLTAKTSDTNFKIGAFSVNIGFLYLF
ncbi:MAG: porin family protein [Bacteroidales bacterium]|nr:porin family protein [Bacteroidales bacterium]